MYSKQILIIGLLLLVFGCNDDNEPVDLLETLQTASEEFILENRLKGMSVAISAPEFEWVGAAGISKEGVAVHPDMNFAIGSITKNLVAVLTLKLEEESALQLDEPIGNYIEVPDQINSDITIRQLLNHTSGLADYIDTPGFLDALFQDPNRSYTWSEILSSIGEPLFAPGEGFAYSNSNYILLGAIIEHISAQSFIDALRNRVLSPSGIVGFYLPPEENILGETVNYWSSVRGNGLEDISALPRNAVYSSAWTAGGVWASVLHLNHWTQQLNQGEVLSNRSLEKIATFLPIQNTDGSKLNGYGFGTMRFLTVREWIGHTGDIFGFGSISVYSRQDQMAITALFNQEVSENEKLEIVDKLFEVITTHNR